MKSRGRNLIILVCVLALTAPTARLLGYGTPTHATITVQAYIAASNVINNFFQRLDLAPQHPFTVGAETFGALDWLVAGSIREDTGTLPQMVTGLALSLPRPTFHFFDPVYNRGLLGQVVPHLGFFSLNGTTPSGVWGVNGFGTSTECFNASCSLSGVVNSTNDFPYASSSPMIGARSHYLNGLIYQTAAQRDQEFGQMFRSLGQMMHLLQDAAQPQHVRNDPHIEPFVPLTGTYFSNQSVYEHYVDATYANQPIPGTSYNPPTFPLPLNFFVDGAGRGLAEFTNSNFVSAGTNCTTASTNSCNSASADGKPYASPTIDGTTDISFVNLLFGGDTARCQAVEAAHVADFPNLCTADAVRFLGNTLHDSYIQADTQNDFMSTYSIFDQDLIPAGHSPILTLNDFNYAQQATLLLPRAAGYSAGILNYFFRGDMTAQGGPAGFTITNTSCNGGRFGAFSCVGGVAEDMSGTFNLYYDDANGNRKLVPGATWSLSIAGGATSSSLTFAAPTSPVTAQAGRYILVFHGTLGSETGAVAGQVVQLDSFTLSVSVTGTGTVTSSPAGINCGTNCSAPFASGTLVTLTASPGPGSTFAAWSGTCSGNLPVTAVTLSASSTCLATFTASALICNGGLISDTYLFGGLGQLVYTEQRLYSWQCTGLTYPILARWIQILCTPGYCVGIPPPGKYTDISWFYSQNGNLPGQTLAEWTPQPVGSDLEDVYWFDFVTATARISINGHPFSFTYPSN